MQKNHQESPLFIERAESQQSPSLFDELNAISQEIERCRSIAQN